MTDQKVTIAPKYLTDLFQRWLAGYNRVFGESLSAPPPAGFGCGRWSWVMETSGWFLDNLAIEAHALGWSEEELFGLDPDAPFADPARTGIAFLVEDCGEVLAVTAKELVVRVHGRAHCLLKRGVTVPAFGIST